MKIEHSDGDAQQADGESPDVVLRDSASHRVLRVCAVETRLAMIPRRSERWRRFARLGPLTLIVPKGAAREAERLLCRTEARVVEYERVGDEVLFSPAL